MPQAVTSNDLFSIRCKQGAALYCASCWLRLEYVGYFLPDEGRHRASVKTQRFCKLQSWRRQMLTALLIERCSDEIPAFSSIAAQALFSQLRLVLRKKLGAFFTKLTQVGPGEYAGVVHIVEADADSIVAGRRHRDDCNVALAGHGDLLAG